MKVDPEQAERADLQKDIAAVTKLTAECRNVGLLLTEWQVPHSGETQTQLKGHVQDLTKFQNELDAMIFKAKPGPEFNTWC